MSELPGGGTGYLASMGIYIFKREVLEQAVANPQLVDFGRHVIPDAVPRQRVQAHVYRGYWEDVGTIQSYFQANLALCDAIPPFDFYDAKRPVYTHPRFLPASKLEGCNIQQRARSPRAASCTAPRSTAPSSASAAASARGVAHPQQPAHRRRLLRDAGGDARAPRRAACPPVGIGAGLDHRERDRRQERAHRPRRAHHQRGGVKNADGDGYFIREGIVIVPKNGVIRNGTVI